MGTLLQALSFKSLHVCDSYVIHKAYYIQPIIVRDATIKDSVLSGTEDVVAFFSEYRFKAQEHFLVGYLNSRNALIAAQVLNVGLTTESIVDVNNCIAMALLVGASKVVFVHNHPSGEALPSQADKNITEEMRRKFRMFSIAVVDHVILGNGTYFSFCEEGLLA